MSIDVKINATLFSREITACPQTLLDPFLSILLRKGSQLNMEGADVVYFAS
jgi:hypothetical protein